MAVERRAHRRQRAFVEGGEAGIVQRAEARQVAEQHRHGPAPRRRRAIAGAVARPGPGDLQRPPAGRRSRTRHRRRCRPRRAPAWPSHDATCTAGPSRWRACSRARPMARRAGQGQVQVVVREGPFVQLDDAQLRQQGAEARHPAFAGRGDRNRPRRCRGRRAARRWGRCRRAAAPRPPGCRSRRRARRRPRRHARRRSRASSAAAIAGLERRVVLAGLGHVAGVVQHRGHAQHIDEGRRQAERDGLAPHLPAGGGARRDVGAGARFRFLQRAAAFLDAAGQQQGLGLGRGRPVVAGIAVVRQHLAGDHRRRCARPR